MIMHAGVATVKRVYLADRCSGGGLSWRCDALVAKLTGFFPVLSLIKPPLEFWSDLTRPYSDR